MRNWGVPFSVVELVAQGYCTTWVGIALLSCQCNTVLSGALVPAASRGQCERVVLALTVLTSSSCRAGREKVRPARSKHPRFGVFALAGRVFSRNCRCGGRAGRVFRANRHCSRSCRRRAPSVPVVVGGFARYEAVVQRVAGVSDPRVVQFPHRVAVRSRLEVVRHPKCRPARRKVLKTGRCGRGGLRLEHVASGMAHMRRCPGIE